MGQGEEVEAETYLDLAVTQWLPQRWDCSACDRALSALAANLEARHGDRWLRDALSAKQSPGIRAGLRSLAEAVRANQSDESESALGKAVEATELLGVAGSSPGRVRAEFEQVYALHRRARSASECLKKAREVERDAAAGRYQWLHAQAVLEQGNCLSLLGQSMAAHGEMERALKLARQAGYGDLELRAASILTDVRTESGNLLSAWEEGRDGLAKFESGVHSGIRAQQIYLNLARSADGLGLKQTAYVFQGAAAAAIGTTPRRRTEAISRAYLAGFAVRAGWAREAQAEFDQAAALFDQLSQADGGEYRTMAELYRAQAELTAGAVGPALRRLEAIRGAAGRLDAANIRQIFYATFGDALQRAGRSNEAEQSYRDAIQLSESDLSGKSAYRDRARHMLTAGRAYRALAGLLWERGDAAGALRVWEWFRGAEDPRRGDASDLDRRLPALRRETFLTFAELSGGIVAWVYDDQGVTGRRLAVKPEELETVAARFLRECADRESDTQALERDARQLYGWLIAPVADRLDPARTLVVEPDGAAASIPIQALMGADGRYLGDRFAIAVASSVADYQRRAAAGAVDAGVRALVVADPLLDSELTKAFPPLRGTLDEGRAVAGRFRGAALLSGKDATLAAVERNRAAAELFHFAGHGFSNAGNGGLLLAPGSDAEQGSGVLEGRAMAEQDWRRCRLAVLSACSAGTGEARGPVNPESLVRGLLWSGVARVVASRWNVDTRAGVPFIDQFYDRLLSGDDTAAALQHAARSLRQDAATRHPYYWAGFQSFGTR